MSNSLHTELAQLRDSILEMMQYALLQTEKSKESFLNMDTELAEEIIHTEKRINGMEIAIDRDCENILALHTPYASDLRYVISSLKINSDLERIADYAENIAKYVVEIDHKYDPEVLDQVQLKDMFDIAISMLAGISEAFEEKNSKKARKIYKQDKLLNAINKNSSNQITKLVEKDPSSTRSSLYLFSTIRKIERLGDHVKNIAENIIFSLEAKVLKHKKKKKE